MKAAALKTWREDMPRDGKFHGKWTGNKVAFVADGSNWESEADCGIRGLNVPCVVVVVNGVVTVETITTGSHPERRNDKEPRS